MWPRKVVLVIMQCPGLLQLHILFYLYNSLRDSFQTNLFQHDIVALSRGQLATCCHTNWPQRRPERISSPQYSLTYSPRSPRSPHRTCHSKLLTTCHANGTWEDSTSGSVTPIDNILINNVTILRVTTEHSREKGEF